MATVTSATEAGRDPHDRALTDLVGELHGLGPPARTTHSSDSSVRPLSQAGRLRPHAVVGDITLNYNTVPLPADPGLSLTAYTAEPATASADKLALLASWAATPLSGIEDATTAGSSNSAA